MILFFYFPTYLHARIVTPNLNSNSSHFSSIKILNIFELGSSTPRVVCFRYDKANLALKSQSMPQYTVFTPKPS